jgi:hypothetical protein
MRRDESPAPARGIGWAFGVGGFVVTMLVGRYLDAGLGFVLVMAVFWTGVGRLFSTLVARSTTEEIERVRELRHVRLATLQAPPETPRPPRERRPTAHRTEDAPTASRRASDGAPDADARTTRPDGPTADRRSGPAGRDRAVA